MADDREFNLLDEPWIKVMDGEGRVADVGLRDCFRRAHEFKALAGDMPPQDVAVLRLLLAILYAALARDLFRRGGDWKEARDMWKGIWEAGLFPMDRLETYFKEWQDRFWLFHPERPFYQVNGVQGTRYSAAKLFGDLSESENKVRLFPIRAGAGKKSMDKADAARWLLYLIAFDDTSVKPSKEAKSLNKKEKRKHEEKNRDNRGSLAGLGLVYVVGGNLFQTLLMNWVLFDPFHKTVYPDEPPCWEVNTARVEERAFIRQPLSPCSLFTLQSRRISLERDRNDQVTGYRIIHGDGFDGECCFAENMTLWRLDTSKNAHFPKPFDAARQSWRDLQALTLQDTAKHHRPPGVLAFIPIWQKTLGIKPHSILRINTMGVEYCPKKSSVDNAFADTLTMNAGLLKDLVSSPWLHYIHNAVHLTDDAVCCLGRFAGDLLEFSGVDKETVQGKRKHELFAGEVREQAFFALDVPFRNWLAAIDPESDNLDATRKRWLEETMKRLLLNLSSELLGEMGIKCMAVTGKEIIKWKIIDRDGKTIKIKVILHHAMEALIFLENELSRIVKGV